MWSRPRSASRFVVTALAPVDGVSVTGLSLASVKAHLRVTDGNDDALITALIDAALDWLEDYVGCSITSRAWQVDAESFRVIEQFPRFPVTAITSLAYLDTTNTMVTMDPTEYRLTATGIYPAPGTYWPDTPPTYWNGLWPDPVENSLLMPGAVAPGCSIRCIVTAGYASDEIPQRLIAAALRLIGTMYQDRETIMTPVAAVEMPFGVRMLVDGLRRSFL